jgi:hypothetical protein
MMNKTYGQHVNHTILRKEYGTLYISREIPNKSGYFEYYVKEMA